VGPYNTFSASPSKSQPVLWERCHSGPIEDAAMEVTRFWSSAGGSEGTGDISSLGTPWILSLAKRSMGDGSGLVGGSDDTGDKSSQSPAVRGRLLRLSFVSMLRRGRFEDPAVMTGVDIFSDDEIVAGIVVRIRTWQYLLTSFVPRHSRQLGNSEISYQNDGTQMKMKHISTYSGMMVL
jgi:hypothetical protein